MKKDEVEMKKEEATPTDPYTELRARHKTRELVGFGEDEDGEIALAGFAPQKAHVIRYAKTLATRGIGMASHALMQDVFPVGECKQRLDDYIQSNPWAELLLTRTVLDLIGASTHYEPDGSDGLCDPDTGFIYRFRKVTRGDVNKMMQRLDSNPVAGMREFIERVCVEPEAKALKAYLDQQPGRVLSLYDAVNQASGGNEVFIAKKL